MDVAAGFDHQLVADPLRGTLGFPAFLLIGHRFAVRGVDELAGDFSLRALLDGGHGKSRAFLDNLPGVALWRREAAEVTFGGVQFPVAGKIGRRGPRVASWQAKDHQKKTEQNAASGHTELTFGRFPGRV